MIGGFFMKENLTELVFILDRSGSMGGLESDTIGGYNAMLSKQKNQLTQSFMVIQIVLNTISTAYTLERKTD